MGYLHKVAACTQGRMISACMAVFMLAFAVGSTNAVADENSGTGKYLQAKKGQLIDVRLGELHPTQAVLGKMEVYYKLGRYQAGKDKINKRFDDWCEANGQERATRATASSRLDDPTSFGCAVPVGAETPATIDPMKTVVVGKDGRLYLVDGHHTFTSFMESPDGGPEMHVRVRVLGNLSQMESEAFWKEMEKNGWVWLRDAHDRPISVDRLPKNLGLKNFANDDFRGLIYFTRGIAYEQNAGNANYQEFHWGTWLRGNPSFNLDGYDLTNAGSDADTKSYLSAMKKAAMLIAEQSGSSVISAPLTASELGSIKFNEGEYTKAAKDYCNAKPGKIGYAMYYYHNVLGNQPLMACQ